MGFLDVDIRGIKCDKDECDFIDMNVPNKEYDQWLNKPCPKCGSNLLTEADYKTVKLMIRISKIVNFLMWPFGCSQNRATLKVKMNGSGKLFIE